MIELTLSRRGVLILGGGAASLPLSACRAGETQAGGSDGPYAPWRLWAEPAIQKTPMALVAAAILAANPHDTQPWRFRVLPDSIEVLADLDRHLGAMDAFVREMHLGLGCAIENASLASAANGFGMTIEVEPGALADLKARTGTVHVATLRLTAAKGEADPLLAMIPRRHTHRGAYDRARALPADWIDSVRRSGQGGSVQIFLFDGGDLRTRFDAAVIEATQAIVADATMIGDSDRWFRGSRKAVDEHRDGPSLETAGLSPAMLAMARLVPVSAEASHKAWLDQTRNTQLATAPVVGLIVVKDRYDRAQSVAAGRAWQRLHLSATARGIAAQPLNQPIEMVDRRRQVAGPADWEQRLSELTGRDWQATFAFRVGYASAVAPASARRPLSAVVLG